MNHTEPLRHGSLFSGIGGFDLAAESVGWTNVLHCEINPFGRRLLSYYWPDAVSIGDITKTDFTPYHGTIDIISGGFPCQPFSAAGLRKGTDDPRHLWPAMCRAIREIAPRYVVGENVRGLINWSDGLVFDQVHTDLEAIGYEVQAFMVPAAGVGAPHQRQRIWFVAYAAGHQFTGRKNETRRTVVNQPATSDTAGHRRGWSRARAAIETGESEPGKIGQLPRRSERLSVPGDVTHTAEQSTAPQTNQRRTPEQNNGQKVRHQPATACPGEYAADTASRGGRKNNRERKSRQYNQTRKTNYWQDFPTQSPICSGNDGLPGELDGITIQKWRNESIKGYGNAIVPQVAIEIFAAIQEHHERTQCSATASP